MPFPAIDLLDGSVADRGAVLGAKRSRHEVSYKR
jgi:hypothetical protein